MTYSLRQVEYFELPLGAEVDVLHPERVILLFGSKSIDVGAICYLRRSRKRRGQRKSEFGAQRMVDLDSLSTQRIDAIRKLTRLYFDDLSVGGKRIPTVYRTAYLFDHFMQWADEHGHGHALSSISAAYFSFRSYVGHLRELVAQNVFNVNTAREKQMVVSSVLSGFWQIDDIDKGVNLLRKNKSLTESTEPPCEDSQARVLSLCDSLFSGLAELILTQKPYPHRITIPDYIGWPDNSVWIFPVRRRFKAPSTLANRALLGRPYWGYDYANGCVADPQAITEYLVHGKREAKRLVADAEKNIYDSNKNSRHIRRIADALLAHNAFVVVFLANTGLNATQIEELPWSSEYSIKSERQGFRAVKWRAGGRRVSIEIQIAFLPAFKKYLALRDYLLDGVDYDRLFLTLGPNQVHGPRPINLAMLQHTLYDLLRIFDPALPMLSASKWRAGRSDWFLRHKDPSTTADALQNSEKTVLEHYAAGSITTASEEMSEFFEHVSGATLRRMVVPAGEQAVGAIEGPMGSCVAFGDPHQLSAESPMVPDCKTQEGCLFCDKYRVHADKTDVRKLLSCRFCISEISHHPGVEDFFSSVYKQLNSILGEIEASNGGREIIEQITHEVETLGELDPYWSGKLEQLISLELA